MGFPFQPEERVLLPIHGIDALFPVNQVYCVGRNYAAHAREMGMDDRKPPFFFTKPSYSITTGDVKYPPNTQNLQHEVELVLAVGQDMSIFGFAVGVDLTRRDLQGQAKKDGKPWFRGKSFVGSAPISKIIPIEGFEELSGLELRLMVNGELRQSGSCADMIWLPQELLCEMAADVPLKQGDLIFTGTTEGVSKINTGDIVEASILNKIDLNFTII